MTSELKPFDRDKLLAACEVVKTCNLTTAQHNAFSELFDAMSDALSDALEYCVNTRAVPDVPELVRYTYDTWPVSWCLDNVEMVNADQAAAAIAAEIERLRLNSKGIFRRAEAAEDKLAHSEERIADLLKEVESLSVIVASGINDVAGASLDDLEAEVSELKSKLAQIEKQEVIEVRKLEWHQLSAANKSCLFTALNNQIGVRYYILENTDKAIIGDTVSYTSQGLFGKSTCHYEDGHKSIDIAKSAAQADYDKRIASCITAAPVAGDADLRAERETITGYVSSNDKSVISKGGGWCILVHARQTEIYSNPVTVAALDPSEPRT